MDHTSPLGGRSRLRILRQSVAQLYPLHLAARIDVVARRHRFGTIKAAGRDIDLIGIIIGLKRRLGAAMGTEAAASLAARPEARRMTVRDSQLQRPDPDPCHDRP